MIQINRIEEVKKYHEINDIHDLLVNDELTVIIGGKAYRAKVKGYGIRTTMLIVDTSSPTNITWDALGYKCFEDMIDDIAKMHKGSDELALTQDEIQWVKKKYKAIEEQKELIRKTFYETL